MTVLIITLLFSNVKAFCQQKIPSEPFELQFENKTLRGLIESPVNKNSEAIVIIIPGYGKTNFVKGNTYSSLRKN